jgi:hypothetical protein
LVAGEGSGMSVGRLGEVDGWTSEGQAVGVYGTDFTGGSLTRVVARDRIWRAEIKAGSDEELTKIGRMAKRDLGNDRKVDCSCKGQTKGYSHSL